MSSPQHVCTHMPWYFALPCTQLFPFGGSKARCLPEQLANVQQLTLHIQQSMLTLCLQFSKEYCSTIVVVCCPYLGGQFNPLKGMRLACLHVRRILSDVHEVAMRCVSISPRSVEPGCHNVGQSAAETRLLLHPCTHLVITSGCMMQSSGTCWLWNRLQCTFEHLKKNYAIVHF